jgi:hypothetical protein
LVIWHISATNHVPYKKNPIIQSIIRVEKLAEISFNKSDNMTQVQILTAGFTYFLICRFEIQELIAQKDRLEKLIANILNGEGYSKLQQVVKKNVKAVLSDNKIQISISFAAMI